MMTSDLEHSPEGGASSQRQEGRSVSPFRWCLRRELWENRSIVWAPVGVGIALSVAFVLATMFLPQRLAVADGDPARQVGILAQPFHAAAGVPIATIFLVAVFYCLDALQGERRDRSLLFWKSMPVSDRMAVLTKAAVPLAVLPALGLLVGVANQLLLFVFSMLRLAPAGNAGLVSEVHVFELWIALLYTVIVTALWWAPIYGWLLLISAWARRVPILWAVMPPLVLGAFERIAAGSRHILIGLGNRITGWFQLSFVQVEKDAPAVTPLEAMTPLRFLGAPGLWLGLLFAVACIALAVRLRRERDAV